MDFNKKHYLLLKLLKRFNVVEGRTRLQKLVFLLQKQFLKQEYFQYAPYLHGPYSRDLSETTAALTQMNLIEEVAPSENSGSYTYKLTQTGNNIVVSAPLLAKIDVAIDKLEGLIEDLKTTSDLISYVYDKYPKESGVQ